MATEAAAAPASMLTRYSDLVLAGAGLLVLAMLVLPIPWWALDFLLLVNLAFTVIVLLVTMYTLRPLDFAVFPSLLLLGTLFRLALNVSATKLILLHGNESTRAAGAVIETFGQFVVGGNYFVGVVVFAILVIIQFVVITSGAQRVAEVAARFTLDAMPGKQMAIDADLNAGLITEDQARQRRKTIEREADFYGAMDGSSKFVRGDAIAAIVILIVNIIGGFIVGVAQHGLPLIEALQKYTLLTIGEGLVTQIPALVLSTATGLVVTRAASDTHLGQEMAKQIFGQERPLWIAAGVVGFFGVVLGMVSGPAPLLVSFVLAGGFAVMAVMLRRARAAEVVTTAKVAAKEAKPREPENVLPLLAVEPVELDIGPGLVQLADEKQGGDLLERIATLRRSAALEMGMIIPPIRVRDNIQIGFDGYLLRLRGVEVARGSVRLGKYLAINAARSEATLDGEQTKDPSFGLPAVWVGPEEREKAESSGWTVADIPSVLATHISEVLRAHADELLSRQDTQKLLDTVRTGNQAVVEELVPHLLSVGEVQKVLQSLLREHVSIRNLVTILETLADQARQSRDVDFLVEMARQALKAQITRQYAGETGKIRAITIDPRLEQRILDAVQRGERGATLALDPRLGQQVLSAISREVEKVLQQGVSPLVLCSPALRPFLRRLLEKALPTLPIVSYGELASRIEVISVGIVSPPPDAN